MSTGGIALLVFVVVKLLMGGDSADRRRHDARGIGRLGVSCEAGETAVLEASRLRGLAGREREAAEAYERAARAFRDCTAFTEERACRSHAGWAWLDVGSDDATLRKAEQAFRGASTRLVRQRSIEVQASAEIGLANVLMRRDTPASWRLALKGLRTLMPQLEGEDGVQALRLRCAVEIAWCLMPGHTDDGSYEEALAAYRRAEELAARSDARVRGLATWRSVTAYQIGYCLEHLDDSPDSRRKARAYYEESVALAESVQDHVSAAEGLSRLGFSHEETGDHAGAAKFHERAAAAYRAGEAPVLAAAALGEQARHLRARGHEDQARALFLEAESMSRAAGDEAQAERIAAQRIGAAETSDDP